MYALITVYVVSWVALGFVRGILGDSFNTKEPLWNLIAILIAPAVAPIAIGVVAGTLFRRLWELET